MKQKCSIRIKQTPIFEMEIDVSCENEILPIESHVKIFGLIYIIKNTETGLNYVGQTVSHRKNRGKYRPFGILGRFKDHVSEAINNTKRKQCSYLNNAIRKYGSANFQVELLEVCAPDCLNAREQHFIATLDTLFPKGYNLTKGGKTLAIHSESTPETEPAKKRGGCLSRSEETRKKMSERQKALMTETMCSKRAKDATTQHHSAKLQKFKGVKVDLEKIDTYITKKGRAVKVTIEKHTTTFAGKHDSYEQKVEKARAFIHELSNATLSNCGKPVKPE